MYTTCQITNLDSSAVLDLVTDNRYILTGITGLHAPAGLLTQNPAAGGIDGSVISGTRRDTRNLVFTIRIINDVEAARLNLYNIFPTGQKIRFSYKLPSTPALSIDGYVETAEVTPFTQTETITVSVICPDPYFRDATARTISITGAGSGTIDNSKGLDTGIICTIKAQGGAVTNPSITTPAGTTTLNITIASGKTLIISSDPGAKYVSYDGSRCLPFTGLPIWPTIKARQVNGVSLSADSGAPYMRTQIAFRGKYLGA